MQIDHERWAVPGHETVRCVFCDRADGSIDRCAKCGTLRCRSCVCRGCDVIAGLRAAARGEAIGSTDADLKTNYYARTLRAEGRDVLLAADGVHVRALGDATRHRYPALAGPYILMSLMRDAEIEALEGPRVAVARGGKLWRHGTEEARDELVWLLPSDDAVEIRMRPLRGARFGARTIPESGARALPEPWSAEPVFVEAVCPHCGVSGPCRASFDGGSLVCAGCGRSFDR